MEARLARLFLKQVEAVLQQEPSRDSLLRVPDPLFLDEHLVDNRKCSAVLKSLKCLIHPDKHPASDAATILSQETKCSTTNVAQI